MRNLEDDLRDAVLDLADDAPPAHALAAVARARGRRIRRRRRAAVAAVAVALIGVTVTPYTVLRRDPPPAPLPAAAASATPAPVTTAVTTLPDFDMSRPYELPGGAVVTAVNGPFEQLKAAGVVAGGTTHLLYDRAARRYRQWFGENATVVPAPAGPLFAVYGELDNEAIRVMDAKGDVKRAYGVVPYTEPRWSPDGARLLIPVGGGVLIADPARADGAKQLTIPDCAELCTFSWLPGGSEFAVTRLPIRKSGADVDAYDAATGRRTRTLAISGAPRGAGAWSPDLRSVLVQGSRPVELFDVPARAGTQLSGADGFFLPDGRILTVDDNAVKLYDASGRLRVTAVAPVAFLDATLSAGMP